MMLMALYDSNACSNGVTWPKKSLSPHFNNPNLRNAVMTLTVLSTFCDADTVPLMSLTKSHVALHFNCGQPEQYSAALDDTIGIMWYWWQQEWHYMTRNVMLDLISVFVTYWNAVVPLMTLCKTCDNWCQCQW